MSNANNAIRVTIDNGQTVLLVPGTDFLSRSPDMKRSVSIEWTYGIADRLAWIDAECEECKQLRRDIQILEAKLKEEGISNPLVDI